MGLLEKMNRPTLRRIVNRDLTRNRRGGKTRPIRRPGEAGIEIIQLAVPEKIDGAEAHNCSIGL
jgi:hypothetical protein